MSRLISQFQTRLSAVYSAQHVDFDGQHRAENLSRIIIILFGIIGFIWGYLVQQYSQTLCILGIGFVVAAIVTVPSWPMYRRKPLQWQKPLEIPVNAKIKN